jgi:hypothetical protein
MDIYSQIVEKIIQQQESIIGPLAIERANTVSGLNLDWPNHAVSITGDQRSVIDELVAQYKALFGQVSVEVSKDAARKVAGVTPDLLPQSLQ